MATRLHGMTILLVDDEPLIRSVFRRTLTREGATVFDAASVAVARELLVEKSFDLVISDFRMPGWSGADLIDWVRPRWPTLPIVLLSGYPEEAGNVAADLVLSKPLSAEALIQAILSLAIGRYGHGDSTIRPIP